MDSMQLDPETVDNLDAYSHIPPQLMEKCAALSVRPDTVRNLVQSMQGECAGSGQVEDGNMEVTCRIFHVTRDGGCTFPGTWHKPLWIAAPCAPRFCIAHQALGCTPALR